MKVLAIVPTLVLALSAVPVVIAQVKLGEPQPSQDEQKAAAVARARHLVASKLKIAKDELVQESVQPATWPDSSLGCPEKGRMYAQMVTSGYKIVLSAAGHKHEVHVAGPRAVLCPPPAQPPR
jgi:hypothetical protein